MLRYCLIGGSHQRQSPEVVTRGSHRRQSPQHNGTFSSNLFIFTIKTLPGYPWESVGLLGTQEPYFNGPELDHQVLTRLDAKYLQEVAKFDQKGLFLRGFLHLVFLKLDGRVQNPLNRLLDFLTDPHMPNLCNSNVERKRGRSPSVCFYQSQF